MANVDLWYEARGNNDAEPLSVRHFSIHEAMSSPFRVAINCACRGILDLGKIVGRPATFRIFSGVGHVVRPRVWSGVCTYMEQTQAEITGESTYFLQIVPTLARLAYRRSCRIFQQKTIPVIVREVLALSRIEAKWTIDEAAYRKLDYRVQYNEADLDFIERMLVEAGISYYFDDVHGESKLVMTDAPQSVDPHAVLHFTDNPTSADGLYVTHVQHSQAMITESYRIQDYDFRNPPYRPAGSHPRPRIPDLNPEQYRYAPGHSVVETPTRPSSTPVGDDRGVYRSDEDFSDARAALLADGARAASRQVRYRSNAFDLAPGTVFAVTNHPHPDLASKRGLLVIEASMNGTPTISEWSFAGRATFADAPYRPPPSLHKPRVLGPQTGVVVGPGREEIHVDEYGRVRVQFHWDGEGKFGVLDAHSTCWIRVSQGWAGAGYGMMMIPRVGQEVLVGFLDGDPDQPIVVGRLYNETQRVPYPLPHHKTVSTWRSQSTPGSNGFNEIKFDDDKDHELLYVQAQRDMHKLVKHNESITVQGNRSASIGSVDSIHAGAKHEVTIAQPQEPPPTIPPTRLTMVDKKITLTTGEATIELDGPDIKLMAKGNILLSAGGGINAMALGCGALPGPADAPVNGAIEMTALQTMEIVAVGKMIVATTNELQMASARKMQIGSAGDVAISSGANMTSHAERENKLEGLLVQLNAPGLPAGRVLDPAPVTILRGSSTVFIGGLQTSRDITRGPNNTLRYGTGIVIQGDSTYQTRALATILRLDSTPTMHAAYDALEGSGHTLTHIPYVPPTGWNPYNAYAQADNHADACTPGTGSNSTIAWDPDVHTLGGPPETTEPADQPGSDLILAHEQIHGVRNALGTHGNGPMNSGNTNVGEERNTVGLPATTYNSPGDDLHGMDLPDTTGGAFTENRVRQDYADRGWTSPVTGQPPVQRPSYYPTGPGNTPGTPF